MNHWNNWADGVHNHWGHFHDCNNWFNNDWWHNHYHACGGWHYWNSFANYGSNYWWTAPVWNGLTNWFSWGAAPATWSEPVYYDYGTGGNVTYDNDTVYINNEPVASADQFAQSAATLATVAPPANEQEAQQAEWMPLGTFAVSTNEKDVNPSRSIQLAVNKQGIISGALYNVDTDQAVTVQGQVDKNTQRVAFRVGESEDVIVETGLYNLTQDEAPILIHFGKDRVENGLLVRLTQPEETPAP